jgi:DNA ligase-1
MAGEVRMTITHPTLFKRDSLGNVRIWWIEQDESRYRVHSGIQNGSIVISEWKQAVAKGIGKARTTPEEQASREIVSVYKGKTDRTYHTDIANIDNPIMFEVMLAEKYHMDKKKKEKLGANAEWNQFQKRIMKNYPNNDRMFSQPKLDGMRAVTDAKSMMSRGGKPVLGVPHIIEVLEEFFAKFPDAMLDGELYNHEYKDDFNTIIGRIKKNPDLAGRSEAEAEAIRDRSRKVIQYHIYDMPSHDGNYAERYEWLKANLPDSPYIHLVRTDEFTTEEELDELYGIYMEAGYEGQMIRLNTPYENDRVWALLKRKEFEDEEFPIAEIKEGIGNWAGHAKSIWIKLPNGKVTKSGMRGNKAFAKQLLEDRKNYTHVTVRFQNRTPDGVPRFPVAIKFWDRESLELGDRIELG